MWQFILNIAITPLDLCPALIVHDFVLSSRLSQKNRSSLKMWSQFASRYQPVNL